MNKAKTIATGICLFLFVLLFVGVIYTQLMPDVGGLSYETEPIFWVLVFISSEIAVCTYLIVSAMRKLPQKEGTANDNSVDPL